MLRRCGDEEEQQNLDEQRKATLKFIKAAISFIPQALDTGADLSNASFILAQPGRDFVVKAGNGDWEFYFTEKEDGKVHGKCVRTGSIWRWIWNPMKGAVCDVASIAWNQCVLPAVGNFLQKKLTGT